MQFHPLSEIFPLMQGREFDELVADIRANGLRERIWTYEGSVIDGRNRFRACQVAGVRCDGREYDGNEADLAKFVISLNLHRRHLDESQRSLVAGRLEQLKHGGYRQDANLHLDRNGAADLLSVSPRSVASARKVIDGGAPELIAAVEQGRVSVSAAADVATVPKEEQRQIVARGEREILEAAKQIRAGRAEAGRVARIEKIAEIAKGNAPLDIDAKFPVILADPPWRYENPPMGGTNRSIENHYPTMDLEEICALPVAALATDDAILYLWATAPKLAECMTVIAAWGFEYRTCFVWVKDKIGMGYHARNQHELLLVAKRGQLPPPPVEARVSSVIYGERTEHSAKPLEIYRLIESFYPTLPRIELFCRSPQDGWSVWGNQAKVA